MRHLPLIVGAAVLSGGLLAGSGKADAAMPALPLDRLDAASSALEKIGYYRRWYGYRPYYRPYYYRPYGYYRPYYGYGWYGWRRPYRWRY